ncbi:hypothetical protein Syun_010066 [Stephania yunnanensis]|uniref:Uncharacterized protein n=1 Tax=Stephania yunnanensis TaxID=152371 RepID=A0AAP0KI69_9MAGN
MRASCPNVGIKEKPHIESRFKTSGKDWTTVRDIYPGARHGSSGFGYNSEKHMIEASGMNISSISRIHASGVTSSSGATKNIALSLEMIGRLVKRRGLLTIWWLRQPKRLRVDLIQVSWATCPYNNGLKEVTV